VAVALAPDSWTPAEALGRDDFQVAPIAEVWQRNGYIRVEGLARPGYRMCLVVRVKALLLVLLLLLLLLLLILLLLFPFFCAPHVVKNAATPPRSLLETCSCGTRQAFVKIWRRHCWPSSARNWQACSPAALHHRPWARCSSRACNKPTAVLAQVSCA
jgi:hypothetical protein